MAVTKVKSKWTSGGLVFTSSSLPTGIPAVSFIGYVDTAANELGVASYSETHLTGVLAGTLYGSGSWINIDAAATPGANMICAQDNGIYVDATPTITSAKLVIGMRMEVIVADGANPGELYLFSTNIYDNALTAMFDINAKVDAGWITGAATTTTTGHIPLFKEASTGEVFYVNVYTGG